MSSNVAKTAIVFLLLLSLASLSPAQRQTGSISGKVMDMEAHPLPGATVSISGSSLMGVASYVTSNRGFFRFPSLLPGIYELRAEMPEFKSTTRKGLIVNIGKAVAVTIRLEASDVEEEVLITAASPPLDVESAKVTVNYSAPLLANVPLSRDLYDIQNSIPGATSEGAPDRRSSSIVGGTVRSQLYALDGAPLDDPVTSYASVNINFDIYEEVDFEIGAHPAEVGQTDSTYVNIVSKSGGNAYSGGATFYTTGNSLTQDLIPAKDLQAYQMNPPEKFTSSYDFSLNVGGFVLLDRAWFFLNGRRTTWNRSLAANPEARMASLGLTSPHYDYNHQEWLGFAKVTVKPLDNIRYTGMFHYNHVYEPVYENSGGSNTAYENTDIWDHENTFATTHQVNYILDQDTFLDLRGSFIYRSFPIISRTQNQPTFYDSKEDIWWGASAYNDASIRRRLSASASVTRLEDDFIGASHEFKAGAEFEQSEHHRDWYRGNPYYSYWDDYAAGNPYFYSTPERQGRLRIQYCPATSGQWDVQDLIRRFSGYVQDSATRGRLAVNIGLRVDYSFQFEPLQARPNLTYSYGPYLLNPEVTQANALLGALIDQWHTEVGAVSPFERLVAPYKKVVDFFTLSPRIGVVYDLLGDGRTALRISYSRYFEPIWMDKYNSSQIFAPGSVDYYWNDLNSNKLMDLPPTDSYVLQSSPPQDPAYNAYADGLKAPYTDEILAGVEREIIKDFKLGLEFIWKQNRNIVETADVNNGYDPDATDTSGRIWLPFHFTDPGWDGKWGSADDQEMTVYGLRADRPVPSWMGLNPPEAKRRYWAVALTLDKRMAKRWQLKGSILYSSFKGNVDATDSQTEGKDEMFNNPNTLINAYGPLYFDRPLQVKLMGTVLLPWDIIVSAYFQHYSGIPWARTIARVYFPEDFPEVQQPYVEVNAEVSGRRRRSPYTTIDVRLEKGFSTSSRGRLDFYLDIFNLGGRSGTIVDKNPASWLRFDQSPPAYQTSPTYGTVQSVYGVRSFRLGARWSF